MQFIAVSTLKELPPGTMRVVEIEGRDVVVVNDDGQLYAIDNRCPHLGGPLGKGRLEGRELTCPWHGWRWDVKSGRVLWPDVGWRATSYPVKVDDGRVMVRVA
jgi:nitrite reductase/ring-hydroxylating ferredoxin subunit